MPGPFDVSNLLRLSKIFSPTPPDTGVDLSTGRGTFTGEPMLQAPQMEDMFKPSNIGISGRMGGAFEAGPMPQFDNISRPAANPLDLDINSLYTPDNYFLEEYKKMLSSMPEKGKPNIWRRLGGMFFEPGQEQDQFMNAPYHRDMTNWGTKMKALEPALTAERYSNAQERALAGNILTHNAAERRIELAEQTEKRKAADAEADRKIRADRAATYRYRTENPNLEFMEDKDGFIFSVHPQTRKVDYLLNDQGERIKSSSLSEQMKLDMQIKNAKELENLRTANDLKLEGARSANDMREIAARGEQARETKAAPSDTGSVTEDKTVQTTIGPDGKPIFSRETVKKSTKTPGPGTTVRMKDKQGNIYNIPKARVAEAKRDGLVEAPNAAAK